MADNFGFTEGSGKTGAATDIGGVLHPLVIPVESDGTASGVSAKLGSLTEAAPATDTASSGINGRLQRIAQRLTSLIALIPTALTGLGNFKVSLEESNVALPVTDNSSSLTVDAPVGTPIFVRLSDGLSPITTLSVSLASVPSHAVTNAGTFAVQVDGSALTSLQLIDDPVATTGSAIPTKGMAAAGTDGTNARILKTDTNGELQVDVLTMPTVTVNSHAVTNAGTFVTQENGAALTALQKIDDPVLVDDAAFTPGTSSVMVAGFQADESSTDSVDEGDVGAARMTLDRKQHVVAEQESNSMRASGTAVTPKFATIAASSSGNNTIVSAVNPKKIRVLAVQLISNGTVNVKWQSGAGGTDVTGLAYLVANTGYVLPYNPVGWFETSSNTLLNLNLSAAVAVGGSITYIEV